MIDCASALPGHHVFRATPSSKAEARSESASSSKIPLKCWYVSYFKRQMAILPLWTYTADRLSYVVVNAHFPALKTNQTCRQIALNPAPIHVQNGIRRLVSH